MATQPTTGLTWDDLQRSPDDKVRRELIDGELIVTPAPSTRHQQAVANLLIELGLYARRHGGRAFPAPTAVFLTEANVVEPDVLFVRADHIGKIEAPLVRGAPDLAIEVPSPSTRRVDTARKLELYERFGIPEYWFVDLDAERVEVYELNGSRYGSPRIFTRGGAVETSQVPGLSVPVEAILGEPKE